MRVSLFLFLCMIAAGSKAQSFDGYPVINPRNITIIRDSFGVPHIYAKTDAEVAYGLAWANAEDAIHETQDLLYVAKGFMGRKDGIKGAPRDFFVHAIGVRRLVNERYDQDLTPQFKKYINGFAQGLNAYAKAHPEQIKMKRAFPVTGKDIVAAYVIIMSFLTGAQGPVEQAVTGKLDAQEVKYEDAGVKEPFGSNAFALKSTATENGKTFLCINPHMQLDGVLSFYEAHLCSEEGLNILGPMFHGSASLAMGVNESLGWAHTWNYFDKMDVYKLKMHPSKKGLYEFDGQWLKLEKRPVWLKVNLAKRGHFVLPVKKTTYWSKYGCTLKSDKSENYYAIRFPANMTIKTAQQLYEMNKARNWQEFLTALRTNSMALFNMIYADRWDHINYISNGMAPKRSPGYNWSSLLPGNTSKTLWTELYPTDSLPHVFDPDCGYLFNTNNTPFNATEKGCNDSNCRLPAYMDERPGDNNRAHRLMDWFAEKPKHSFDEMVRVKFDVRLSRKSRFMQQFQPLFDLDTAAYPHLKESIALLRSWDLNNETDSRASALFALTLQHIFDKYGCGDDCFVSMPDVATNDFVLALTASTDTLRAWFGKVDVPWGDVSRNMRGNVDLPMRGFPDVLSPTYPVPVKGTKKYKAKHGDTYTMFVQFGNSGTERIESLLPCGNSINPASRYYTNQMELFSKTAPKKMSLRKEDVLKSAELIYHPE